MSCECVTVEYPSKKLMPLVSEAIYNQRIELELLEQAHEYKVLSYKNFPWYKKLFSNDPDWWSTNESMVYCTKKHWIKEALKELNAVRLTAEVSDIVRLTGACIAKIDAWAGN